MAKSEETQSKKAPEPGPKADQKADQKAEKKAPAGQAAGKKGRGQKAEAFATVEVSKARGKQPARLWVRFQKELVPALMKDFKFSNPMQVPRLHKIVLNMGLGEAISNNKLIEAAVSQMAAIAGQKPMITKSRKAIANFKLRENQAIGVMVTLRRDRMYEFFDRLVTVAMPRVRDFKGVSAKAFDGKGNYTLGLREQIIFPEVNYDEVEKIKGLNISIVTTARSDEEGRALLRYLGMPFRN
jgi:large subunit ribosomal protein L5